MSDDACDRCAGPPATHVVRGAIDWNDGRRWMPLESRICAECAAYFTAAPHRAGDWLFSLYEHRTHALSGASFGPTSVDVLGVAPMTDAPTAND